MAPDLQHHRAVAKFVVSAIGSFGACSRQKHFDCFLLFLCTMIDCGGLDLPAQILRSSLGSRMEFEKSLLAGTQLLFSISKLAMRLVLLTSREKQLGSSQ